MATAAERMAYEIAELKRRIQGLERSAAADLRSIDDGTQVVYDGDGIPVLAVGRQPDGTYAVLGENGGVVVADSAKDGAITAQAIIDGALGPEKVTFYADIEEAQAAADAANASASAAQSSADSAASDAAAAQSDADAAKAAADAAQVAADDAEQQALDALGVANSKSDVVFQATAPAGDSNVYWVDTDTGRGHRWDGAAWVEIQDEDVQTALADAAAADAAAQGAQTTADAAKVDAAQAQDAADAADAAASAAQNAANAAQSAADAAQGTADSAQAAAAAAQQSADAAQADADAAAQEALDAAGIANSKGTVYTTATAPAGDPNGLWIDTGNGNLAHTWNGSTWVATQDEEIQAAANAAASADSKADAAQSSADAAKAAADAAQADADNALADAAVAQSTADSKVGPDYVASRGSNLVTNGTGLLGDNTNFSGFTFVASDAPTGSNGSFTHPGHVVSVEEKMPVDPEQVYEFSYYIRETVPAAVGGSRFYGYLLPFDAHGFQIKPTNYMARPGTLTTLAADLNPGDTQVVLTSAEGWYSGATTHMRSLIIWNYVDPGGRAWPANTYSRNFYRDVYDEGAVSGNTITLRSPWTGEAVPAGTELSNGLSGGTYMYLAGVNEASSGDWTRISGRTQKGAHESGTLSSAIDRLPVAAATVTVGWLLNRDRSDGLMAVAGVSLAEITVAADAEAAAATAQSAADAADSKADAAQADADAAQAAASAAQDAADAANQEALDAAGIAADKGKVYAQAAAPTGDPNGLWIDTDAGNLPHTWNGSSWVPVQDAEIQAAADAAAAADSKADTAQSAADAADAKAAQAQADADAAAAAAATAQGAADTAQGRADDAYALADGKVQTFFGTTDPNTTDTVGVGDLWLDQGNGNVLKRWDGSAWDTVQDEEIQQAIQDAANAQAAADGKITTYYGETEPVAEALGDLWVDPSRDNLTLRWSGSAWIALPVGGAAIEDEAITETKIGSEAISTPKIRSNAITAEKLEVGLLAAGFVLTGRLQVGEAYWTPEDGLVIPQPDGGTITLPADGQTSAQITAHLVAKSLTVEDNTTIGGGASVVGTMNLSDGITAPKTAPSFTGSYPHVQSELDYTAFGDIYYGFTSRIGSTVESVSTGIVAGRKIQVVNHETGALVESPDTSAWQSLNPRGIVAIGNFYYVLGMDFDRNHDWYIYKLDSTFAKVGEVKWTSQDSIGGEPAIGRDFVNDTIIVGFTTLSGNGYYRRWDQNLAVYGSTEGLPGWTEGTSSIRGIALGDFDLGAGNTRVLVAMQSGLTYAYDVRGSTPVRSSAEEFPAAGGSKIKGLYWDESAGRFRHLDDTGRLWPYSTFKDGGLIRASFTWYDGEGTTHETTESPEGLYTLNKRGWVAVEVPPAPDANNTDPADVDKANTARVYMSWAPNINTYAEPEFQTTLAVGTRTYQTDALVTGANPPTTNGFESANRAPGRITSTTVRQDGDPQTMILGSGVARLDGVVPPGSVTMYAGGTFPDGWLRCDGAVYNIDEYPDLFAAIGNSYGGDGVVNFRVPDLRSRFPVGAGAIGGLGASEGVASDFDRVARHLHAHDHGGETGGGSADRRVDSVSGTNNSPYANHKHSISSDEIGAHPFQTLHFMIRT